MPPEKTAEELAAEEVAAKKARGDFVEEESDAVHQVSEEEGADEEETPVDEEDNEEEAVEEPADEEEPTEVAEEDKPGAKADDPIMIPKGRFDEAMQKARDREAELQRRLAAAEERKEQKTTSEDVQKLESELDELDNKYSDLILEGEVEKAREVRKQWRQKQNDLFDIRLEQRSTLASKQAIEGMRFDRQLAEYEVKYPVINPDSEEFSQDVANEVRELMDAFEVKGLNPVAALNKAIKYVIRETEQPSSEGKDPDLVRTKRSVAARKKVAEAANASPPDITDKGRDSDKVGTGDGLPDVTKMTPEQFSQLTEAQLRRLRGDTFTET